MNDMNEIPILDLKVEVQSLWGEINEAIQRVLLATQFINGPDVGAFESEVARYLGVKHAIGLNSGTDALTIGLRALGIRAGDEVITTAFSFFATVESILLLGAIPVFADIDPETYNIDASDVARKVTPKTRAIIPVHLYGQPANMERIMEIAGRHGLKVLEDVAQAFGSRHRGRMSGTFGDGAAFSFFPSKTLGAYGDAGLFVTNDDQCASMARMLRSHGSNKKYHNEAVGYNSRLDTIQAAILRVKLPHIDRWNSERQAAARRYSEMLDGVLGITCPIPAAGSTHVFHQYTVRVAGESREALQKHLSASGIQTMVYYPVPIHKLPVMAGKMPILAQTEEAASSVLSLPIWPGISSDIQTRVVEAVRQFMC